MKLARISKGVLKPISLILFVVVLGACSSEQLDLNNSTRFSSADATIEMYDPAEAKIVAFNDGVALEVLDGSTSIRVPTFRVTLDSANYVGVLRCKESYVLESSTGRKINELNEATKYNDMKWMWNSASGDVVNCKFLGTHVYRDKIQDVAADSGSYYYV